MLSFFRKNQVSKTATQASSWLLIALIAFGGLTPLLTNAQAQNNQTATNQTTNTPASTNNSNTQAASADTKNAGSIPTAENLRISGLAAYVYETLTAIGSFFSYVGGSLLDISLSWFVIDMKNTTDYYGITSVIKVVWTLVRDMFNLLFIFSLIFIGLKIVLGVDDTGAKRNLGTLIVAALLINFSLFFSQVIIDFSNVATAQMGALFQSNTEDYTFLRSNVFNISSAFADAVSLDQIGTVTQGMLTESTEGSIDLPKRKFGVGDSFVIGLAVCMMLMFLGFVFAAGAILMFTRYLKLLYYMMFSPVLFLGFVLPSMSKTSSEWWRSLVNQALIGPAYLFMIYVSLLMLQGMQSRLSIADQNTGMIGFIVFTLIVGAFAWGSLLAASKFGAMGSDKLISMGQSAGRWGRGYVQGVVGRNTIGRGSNYVQNKFTTWQNKPSERQSGVGRVARSLVAGTNLDRTIIETTDKGKNARFGSAQSFNSQASYDKQRTQRLRDGSNTVQRSNTIERVVDILQNNPTSVTAPDINQLTNAIRNLSESELTSDVSFETLTNENVAINLTNNQIDTLRKSGRFSEPDINSIRTARDRGFINIASNNAGVYNVTSNRNTEWLGNRSAEQMAEMPPQVFAQPNMAQYIVPNMIDARLRVGGLNDGQVNAIRANIQNYLNTAATPSQVENWRNWAHTSTYAARLNLTFPANP